MRSDFKNEQKEKYYYIKQILLGFFDVFLIIFLSLSLFIFWIYYSKAPASSELEKREIAQTTTLYDSSGEHILYELYGEENRKIISHQEIPNNIRIATIAAEDENFYRHFGIDPVAVGRAIIVNFKNDKLSQGGSTITQQLARNVFLSRDKTWKRKFLEAIFALKIERHYSKDEILDQYLNQVPYGANAYGIETASQTYFGKKAIDLTLDEAALIASIPKATYYYSPYNNHLDELENRKKTILYKMKELSFITEEKMNEAIKTNTLKKIKPNSQPIQAPHFVFYVLDELYKKYGEEFLQTGGLKIYTTLDWNKQQMAQDSIIKGVEDNISKGASNAALVSIDVKTGNILAMVGSKNFFDKSFGGEVNVATSLRQPGSSFKPFAYAELFSKGYSPETMIIDAQTDFGPDGSGKNYVPNNYDGKFHGVLSLRSSLAMSLNIPAVKVLYLAGIDNVINLAHKMGITTLNERERYGLSLVLGGGEVKLVDMVSAFAVFANDGNRNILKSIVKIENREGKIIEYQKMDMERILDQQVARKINSILSDNSARSPVFGTNSPLFFKEKTVAAKTGTTSEFRDAWTVGYTPSIATGIWVGNNDNTPMNIGADGIYTAAPIWHSFMEKVLAGNGNEEFIAYEKNNFQQENNSGNNFKIKTVYYNNKTGKEISEEKAAKTDPKKVDTKIEYIESYDFSDGNNFNLAMPDISDSMFKRWTTNSIVSEEKK